jgi:hypothetical protein
MIKLLQISCKQQQNSKIFHDLSVGIVLENIIIANIPGSQLKDKKKITFIKCLIFSLTQT